MIKKFFQNIIETTQDGFWLVGANGEILDVNAAYSTMSGYSKAELLTMSIPDLEARESGNDIAEHIRKIIENGADRFESTHRRKDGSYFEVEVSVTSLVKNNQIVSFIRDISERKQVEEALRKSEERFRHLSDATFEAIVFHDEGFILSANDQYYEMFGYTPEELAGIDAISLTTTSDSAKYIKHQISIDDISPYEVVGLKKDGTEFPIEIHIKIQELHAKKTRMAAIRDLTKQKQAEEALRRSEIRFRRYYEQGVIGMTTTSIEMSFLDFNDTLHKMFGYSRDEFTKLTWAELTHPEDLEADLEQFNRVLTGKINGYSLEKRFIRKDNTIFFPEISANALRKEDGSVDYFVALVYDITERKQVEKNLVKTTHELGERIKELNCLFTISKLVEKEKITIEEILQGIANIIPPSWQYPDITCAQIKVDGQLYTTDNFTKTKWLQSQEIIIKGKKIGSIEVYYLEEKPEIDEGPFLVEERNLINAIAERSGHIIERLRAELEAQDGMDRFQTLFNKAPISYQSLDETGCFIEVNQTWLDVMGYTKDEVIGKSFGDFLHPGWKDHFKENFPNFKAIGEISGVEFEMCKRDGSYVFMSINGKIDKHPDGSFRQTHCVLRDITAQRKTEQEKEKLESRLQQAQKMEAIGTLAGGIAHDFNNILAAILGYTEMARDDSPSGSTIAKDLDKVLDAGRRAKGLVQQILAFSRQDDTKCFPIQSGSVVKEAIKILRPSLPTTIEINQNIAPATSAILADPTHIHQILMNLCTNAFHAMEETGGKLDISLKEVTLSSEDLVHEPGVKAGTFIQLSICDTGPGITPPIKDRIFDPYFTTKATGKGTGMGLSIVHGIIKNYDGFISLYSELGKGTAFHVFLPVIEKEALPETEVIKRIPIGKERILFVDDEEILAEMGKDMLERLGYHVTVRNSSLEALETFQNQPDQFDLVITDQTMPGMTGADISRRMLQIRPDIPIILCTGYSSIISEGKAKSMGIKEFALKPLTKKDIAVIIRKVLDNP